MRNDVEVEVIKTDNGYVLNWRDDRINDQNMHYQMIMQQQRKKDRGVEVFTDKKKLLARISEII